MAAVMVVVHHAASLNGPQTAPLIAVPASVMDGGVAVFFVLSGFLIYRPFAVSHRVGTPAPPVLGFWWRRLLRLIPAYWAALTLLWLSGAIALGSAWWRYYLFVQPYTRATAVGGLIQAWSLATEVSFYLFVPIWAAVVRKISPRRLRTARADLLGCLALYAAGFGARALISWGVRRAWSGQPRTSTSSQWAWRSQLSRLGPRMVRGLLRWPRVWPVGPISGGLRVWPSSRDMRSLSGHRTWPSSTIRTGPTAVGSGNADSWSSASSPRC